jgi:hypothetical protein
MFGRCALWAFSRFEEIALSRAAWRTDAKNDIDENFEPLYAAMVPSKHVKKAAFSPSSSCRRQSMQQVCSRFASEFLRKTGL